MNEIMDGHSKELHPLGQGNAILKRSKIRSKIGSKSTGFHGTKYYVFEASANEDWSQTNFFVQSEKIRGIKCRKDIIREFSIVQDVNERASKGQVRICNFFVGSISLGWG
jgi:hypothetical protein